MSLEHLDLFNDVDIIQIGARNMQNFVMLAEIGKCRKPILLKRGLANTIEEWLMSAEYIMSGGNENVILCEEESVHLKLLQEILLMFQQFRYFII